MKALQIDHTGSLDALTVRDAKDPLPAEDEVRVRVEAAGVNPSDVGIALGRFPQLVLPRILGRDFAGTVIDGPQSLVGKAVWGTGGGELGLTRDGSHAEMVVVPANAVALRSAHLSAEGAAAMGTPFLAAWSALVDLGQLVSGESVAVTGAAGAVGIASVQIARALGAYPIALVRSADDASELESMDVPIVRTDVDDVSARVKELTDGKGADVATNAVGAPVFAALVDALGKDGRMVILSASAGKDAQLDLFAFYRKRLRFYGLDTASFRLDRVGEILAKIDALVSSGKVREPAVAQRFALDRAREAYDYVREGSGGKVVILPQND